MSDVHKFSDFELRQLLNLHRFRVRDEEGGDTQAYYIARIVRDQVEAHILGREVHSNLLMDIFADYTQGADNVLARIVEEEKRGQVFSPPVYPTYELDEEGFLTGRKMVYENMSGGEHGWREIDSKTLMDPDASVRWAMQNRTRLEEGYDKSHSPSVRYLRRTHAPSQ